jgi:hypothetical protein
MGLTIWILFGSIALIIYILIYTAKSASRKRRRAFEQIVAETAKQNFLEWTQTDIDRHRAIAWCAAKRILFFMDFSDANGYKQLIQMDEVETCQVVNHYSPGADKKKRIADTNISMVELQLVLRDKRFITLLMYSELTDGVFEKKRLSEKARNLKTLITKEKTNA